MMQTAPQKVLPLGWFKTTLLCQVCQTKSVIADVSKSCTSAAPSTASLTPASLPHAEADPPESQRQHLGRSSKSAAQKKLLEFEEEDDDDADASGDQLLAMHFSSLLAYEWHVSALGPWWL